MTDPINVTSVVDQIKTLLLAQFNSDALEVKTAVIGYAADAEVRFKNLAEGILLPEGENLSYSFVVARLKEEPMIIKDQFLSVTQMVGADLQDIANKAVDILEVALKGAIPANL